MAILLKTSSVRVSSIQIMQTRVQNKGKRVWKSRYDGDISLVSGGHGLVLLLDGEQPRLGLRLDEAGRGRRGATVALIDDEGVATGAALKRRLLWLRLGRAEGR